METTQLKRFKGQIAKTSGKKLARTKRQNNSLVKTREFRAKTKVDTTRKG